MKKIITLSLLTASLAATSAFGQGWMVLGTSRSQAWDGFTTAATSAVNSTVDVGLFWAPANTANPMPLASTLTTGTSITAASYTDAQAWADILGSSFTLASDAGGDGVTAATPVIQLTTSRGAVTYNSGNGFDITGTTAGNSVALILLSWNATYATPQAAQTAGSAIGWSYLNSFALASGSTDPSIASPTLASFGTFIPVPEPTTIALAGLGGLSLLLARRKK